MSSDSCLGIVLGKLIVRQVVSLVDGVVELLLLRYGLRGHDLCETLQAWCLEPCRHVSGSSWSVMRGDLHDGV